MSIIDRTKHNLMRHQAASALATWITKVKYADGRQGVSPQDLVTLVKRPEPIFEQVLQALQRDPHWDPNIIRTSKGVISEMGQEREAADGKVIDEGLDDYWQILRQDVLHESCHEHALLLGSPEVWPDFCRQMDMAKDVLLAV